VISSSRYPFLYKQVYYTIAAEVKCIYTQRFRSCFYGVLGLGISHFNESYDYYDGGFDEYNRTRGSIPNIQVTPFGFRYGGDFAGFLEIGLGYKGLLSCGLSYNFNTRKQRKIAYTGGVIILPKDFPVDSNLKYIGRVNSDYPANKNDATFERQLNNISSKVEESGGNAFRLTFIEDHKQRDQYRIKGVSYSCNYDSLKAHVQAEKNKSFEKEKCAYLVIYLPATVRYKARLVINDTIELKMKRNAKCVYKLSAESPVKLSTKSNGSLNIDAKFGNTYYVRTSFKGNRATVTLEDNLKGELESSYVRDTHIKTLEKEK
jgi:hypothetical protein